MIAKSSLKRALGFLDWVLLPIACPQLFAESLQFWKFAKKILSSKKLVPQIDNFKFKGMLG
ncbi:hypothetical protein BJP37_01410 [Moorena bouillonii PNG]|uniref:Uncharacterized protein n=1 Tax=Moorena bouillonii PNG TaxID=568701 RepID=A0A1U7MVY8_9CYAN|nr:hypothetical protein BJP37_01410 [Moorena bouillonii PNG]